MKWLSNDVFPEKDYQTDPHHEGHPQSSLRRQSQVGPIEMEGLPKVFSVSLVSFRLHLLPLDGSQAMIEGLVGVVVDLKVSAASVQGWWAVPCTSRSPSSVRAMPASSFGIVEAAAVAGRGWGGRLLGLVGLLDELLGGKRCREELLRTTFCCCLRLASSWHNISTFHFFPRDSIRVRISKL